MKRYKAVIFDLDGTLLDTLTDLAEGTNFALRRCGFPERSPEEIRQFLGNGARKLLERSVPEQQMDSAMEELERQFNRYYKEHCKDHTGPYPGILEILGELADREYLLGVVSNKPDFAVQELIPEYFPGFFASVSGERKGVSRKPAADLIWEAMEKLHVTAEEAVYVGDSEVDLETAANAGIPCIAVTWGFRGRKFLEDRGAAVIAETPAELLGYV